MIVVLVAAAPTLPYDEATAREHNGIINKKRKHGEVTPSVPTIVPTKLDVLLGGHRLHHLHDGNLWLMNHIRLGIIENNALKKKDTIELLLARRLLMKFAPPLKHHMGQIPMVF